MKNSKYARTFNAASELLDANVALRGDKVAIFCGDERVTYKSLKKNVNKFANVLKALGVKPEACVYLDDLGINCKPAAALGMRAIKVVDVDQTLAELSAATGLTFEEEELA